MPHESRKPTSDRLLIRLARTKALEPLALRALLKATHLLGLALGARLAEMQAAGVSTLALQSKAEENGLHAAAFAEGSEILAARWEKVPDRHRPFYSSEQRYRILRLKQLLALSQEETARRFVVSPETIARWEREGVDRDEPATTRPLVRPKPPVRRFADVVRQLVRTMDDFRFGGNDLIAGTLARAGWKLSSRTVGRIREERRSPEAPEPVPSAGRVFRAKYPNHIWMADVTEIPGLFRLFTFKLAVVFDVFSRMPLAASVQRGKPTAKQVVRLLRRAATVAGWPQHFVSDHDRAFTAIRFRKFLRRHGIRQRFGAVGRSGSIALIERLWRTLKTALPVKLFPPLVLEEAQRRVELGLVHYAFFRAHQGLRGATPPEIYFRLEPAHLSAKPPPRGTPGQAVEAPKFEIVFLDTERRLPVLVRKAA